jgi:hypothetical protein
MNTAMSNGHRKCSWTGQLNSTRPAGIAISTVMPGLVPGIHEHLCSQWVTAVFMDCRNESGNDNGGKRLN